MKSKITISLDDELKTNIETHAKENKSTENDIISEAIKQYLFNMEMKKIRQDLKKYAIKAGFSSEDDVYKEIS